MFPSVSKASPKNISSASSEKHRVKLFNISSPKRKSSASLRGKQRASSASSTGLRGKQGPKIQLSSSLGASDTKDNGLVDKSEAKLFEYSTAVPLDSISTWSSNNARATDINKMMLKNFINEHGFESLRSLAPKICGRNMESTIEKLASSPTFNDDYRSLVVKASSHKSKNVSNELVQVQIQSSEKRGSFRTPRSAQKETTKTPKSRFSRKKKEITRSSRKTIDVDPRKKNRSENLALKFSAAVSTFQNDWKTKFKSLQTWKMQLITEFDKLKAELAAETANAEHERKAKLELSIERDALKAQIQSMQAAQSQYSSEQQRFQLELEQAQSAANEITIERDELLARIALMSKANVDVETLKLALANESVSVEIERNATLAVTKERDELKALLEQAQNNTVRKALLEQEQNNTVRKALLEQEQNNTVRTEQQHLTTELEETQRKLKQVTLERNELQAKIQYNLNVELEMSQASSEEAMNLQDQLTAQIKKLKMELANETVNVESQRNIIAQLREDLKLSQAVIVEAKKLQVQQSEEIEKLKVSLAAETVNVENERNAKLEVSTERDALKAQIQVIKAEAESNLNEMVQLRLAQESSQASTEQQRLSVELETALTATKKITIERDELLSKVELLSNDLELSQAASVEAKNLQGQQSEEIEQLKVALAAETINMENERNAKLEAFKERDELKAQIEVIVSDTESTKVNLTMDSAVAVNDQIEKVQALQEELSTERTAKTEALEQLEIITVEVQNLRLEIQAITEENKQHKTQNAELVNKLKGEIATIKPAVNEHAVLLIEFESLQNKLAAYFAVAMFITETKLITNRPMLRWKDELLFPMLVKNEETGERNVLCLHQLEADNVPDVTTLSNEKRSKVYITLALPPISNATTGEDGTCLLLQLYGRERGACDKLIAQGLVQVRGPATGEKKGLILLHLDCVVKGLADSVLFRCQYEWRSSTSDIEQPILNDGGSPKKLLKAQRRQLRINHLAFEARQRYELIFGHIDAEIRRILGDTCPAVSVELYQKHTIKMLNSIEFEKGKADLIANDKLILAQVAKAIKEVHRLSLEHGIPPLIVSVEGHTNCTDPVKRSSPYHMRLSKKRANACRKYLKSAGIEAKYLQSKGFGGTVRISESDPQANQRTEFNIVDNFEEEIQRRIETQLADLGESFV